MAFCMTLETKICSHCRVKRKIECFDILRNTGKLTRTCIQCRTTGLHSKPETPLPCFTQQDWDDWWRLNPSRTAKPCDDCTPQYQQDMKAEGRCTFPKIQFVWRARDIFEYGLKVAESEELIGTESPRGTDKTVSIYNMPFSGIRNYRDCGASPATVKRRKFKQGIGYKVDFE